MHQPLSGQGTQHLCLADNPMTVVYQAGEHRNVQLLLGTRRAPSVWVHMQRWHVIGMALPAVASPTAANKICLRAEYVCGRLPLWTSQHLRTSEHIGQSPDQSVGNSAQV